MEDLQLHDIKPLVEIQDNSLMFLIIVTVIASVLILGIIYLLYKFIKNRKKINIRRQTYKKIQKIDLEDTKNAAYEITFLGLVFKDDSVRLNEAYNNLVQRLEPYKYKRVVEPFSDEVKSYYNIFVGMCDA